MDAAKEMGDGDAADTGEGGQQAGAWAGGPGGWVIGHGCEAGGGLWLVATADAGYGLGQVWKMWPWTAWIVACVDWHHGRGNEQRGVDCRSRKQIQTRWGDGLTLWLGWMVQTVEG